MEGTPWKLQRPLPPVAKTRLHALETARSAEEMKQYGGYGSSSTHAGSTLQLEPVLVKAPGAPQARGDGRDHAIGGAMLSLPAAPPVNPWPETGERTWQRLHGAACGGGGGGGGGGATPNADFLPLLCAANSAAAVATATATLTGSMMPMPMPLPSPRVSGKRSRGVNFGSYSGSPPQSVLALTNLPCYRQCARSSDNNQYEKPGSAPDGISSINTTSSMGTSSGKISASDRGKDNEVDPAPGPRRPARRARTDVVVAAKEQVDRRLKGDEHTTLSDEASVLTTTVKRPKKRGYRKATHTIRKEEMERLRVELKELQTQMAGLQRRALVSCERDEEDNEDRSRHNHVLWHAVREQQMEYTRIQALMAGYAACNIQAGSPIQCTIRLGKDEQTRRETLRALKPSKIHDARAFFRRRQPHLDPLKTLSEDYHFENADGDYWAARLAVSQFDGARSVRQIFDLVVYYLCNIEISVSEKLGHITVRLDDDSPDEGISQNRLVSTTTKGLRMESNTVIFFEYLENGTGEDDEDGYGLIVADFVDEDKRHPYNPNERIRKDVNTVMEVRSYPRRRRAADEGDAVEPDQEERVVVLKHWVHSRLHYPSFPVPRSGWCDLRENMDRWSQSIHKTIMEDLYPLSEGQTKWASTPRQ